MNNKNWLTPVELSSLSVAIIEFELLEKEKHDGRSHSFVYFNKFAIGAIRNAIIFVTRPCSIVQVLGHPPLISTFYGFIGLTVSGIRQNTFFEKSWRSNKFQLILIETPFCIFSICPIAFFLILIQFNKTYSPTFKANCFKVDVGS